MIRLFINHYPGSGKKNGRQPKLELVKSYLVLFCGWGNVLAFVYRDMIAEDSGCCFVLSKSECFVCTCLFLKSCSEGKHHSLAASTIQAFNSMKVLD